MQSLEAGTNLAPSKRRKRKRQAGARPPQELMPDKEFGFIPMATLGDWKHRYPALDFCQDGPESWEGQWGQMLKSS